MKTEPATNPHENALREIALSYPEAYEEFPWGERAIKVRKKVFVFLGSGSESFGISVKLPVSAEAALSLPFAEPTHYGLGKSGWVTARFPAGETPPLPILRAWIEESFRAIAPKTLVAHLDGAAPAPKRAPRSTAPKVAKSPARSTATKVAAKGGASAARSTSTKPASGARSTRGATKGTSEKAKPKRA
ncbi:MmcQ/YjbR family DNA-binding protein [Vulgatibacter incomptus]|uniref:DifB protein n=1 Tax=Vulgatibacter incomptus TaxID=1391653 RepID=A0A0K1PJC4_9BACT|nr:MmcQ/YjbR family DNA-binding protein [Vulgatibacter incomptus]AKU93199.1 DifB protein [Vulgatibacter incomptus]